MQAGCVVYERIPSSYRYHYRVPASSRVSRNTRLPTVTQGGGVYIAASACGARPAMPRHSPRSTALSYSTSPPAGRGLRPPRQAGANEACPRHTRGRAGALTVWARGECEGRPGPRVRRRAPAPRACADERAGPGGLGQYLKVGRRTRRMMVIQMPAMTADSLGDTDRVTGARTLINYSNSLRGQPGGLGP